MNLLQFCLAVEDFNKKMMVSFCIFLLKMIMMVIFFISSLIMMMNDHDDDDDDDQVVDLPDEKLQALHKEAKVLYDSYIKVTDHNHCHVIVIIVI